MVRLCLLPHKYKSFILEVKMRKIPSNPISKESWAHIKGELINGLVQYGDARGV